MILTDIDGGAAFVGLAVHGSQPGARRQPSFDCAIGMELVSFIWRQGWRVHVAA